MSSLAVELASKLSGKGNVIPIHVFYVKALEGDYIAAALLSQLLYWFDKMNGKEFYKSDEELCDELCLSPYQLRRARSSLKEFGVTTKRKGVPARMHYKINSGVLNNKLLSLLTTVGEETSQLVIEETSQLIQKTTSIDYTIEAKGKKPEEAEKPNAFKRLETINPNHAQKCVIELERKGFNLEQVLKPWTDEDLQTLLIEAVKKASPARAGYKWADFITFTDSCEILPTTKQAPKVLESARPNFEIGQEINTPNGKDTIIELTNAWICTERGDYRWDECQA